MRFVKLLAELGPWEPAEARRCDLLRQWQEHRMTAGVHLLVARGGGGRGQGRVPDCVSAPRPWS
jgi:hypothetical protein